MTRLKVTIAVLLIALAGLAILLTRFFSNEAAFFSGSPGLTRSLVLDLGIKRERYPSFLAENSGFLVVHPRQAAANHRDDILETRAILALLEKSHKNTIPETDPLYAELELLFLKKTALGLRAKYFSLPSLGIKSIFFDPDYLAHFAEIYTDKLPHAAGYAVMGDGSQRQIRDILIG